MIRKQRSGHSERHPEKTRRARAQRRAYRGWAWAPEGLEERVLMSGQTYTVDQTTDTGAGSGTSGDLRYAITQANANDGSTIEFAVTGVIALSSALPDVTANLTIDGPGASSLTIQGTTATRVVAVDGATVAISGLTIADGTVLGGGTGGGILNTYGTISVTACTFTGNSASTGGAIENVGQLTATDCTFAGNSAGGGGAIWSPGTATITDSTFSNNSAGFGGGAITNELNLTVSGCTFSGNSVGSEGRGGAIYNYFATTTISNSTFVNNSAVLGGGLDSYYSSASYGASHAIATLTDVTMTGSSGGGIDNEGDTTGYLTLNNSLIAGNSGGDMIGLANPFNCTYNLIGDGSQMYGIGNGSDGNQVGTSSSPIDAQLGSLASNGGPTQTIALLAGSPALNAGSGAATTDTDQRGVPRGHVMDIGAYQATAAQLAVAGFPTPVAPGASHAFTVSAVDPFGQPALDFNAPVTFSSSDPSAALPTGQSLIAGQGTFSATLSTPGVQSITASAGGLSGSQTGITVTGTSATATFLKEDTTTEGNWINTYGGSGYEVISSTNSYVDLPAGVTVTPAGETTYTYASPANTVTQALEVPGGASRIAACWYSSTSFTVDVDVSTGSYDLELYALDYNGGNARSEKIQFTNAGTGAVLSTETLSKFSNGAYLNYTISGNVLITITKTGGANAVLNGLFFDPSSPTTPTITWATPANIVYGTALSGTQLDATAGVPGTFTYKPAAGTILTAGNDQTLSVTFTPTSTTDYTTASDTVAINVLQATPTINWATPANIVYGTALSGTQLDATSSWTVAGVSGSVAGNFTYTPAAGTVLAAGNNQTLSVNFAPKDSTDFTSAAASVEINVTAATTAAATFLEKDTTTQGNWIGTYGSSGYEVISGTNSFIKLPAGVTVTPAGETTYTYATPANTVTQALEVPGGASRIAACWYSSTSFTVDVDVPTGSYNLELYVLDYNGGNARSEQIQFTNASTGAVLNTQTVSKFSNGAYLNYTIAGNVLITITKTGGVNAVLNGFFFDPTPAATFLKQDTTTEGNWIGTYGTSGYEVISSTNSYIKLPAGVTLTPAGETTYTYATPANTVTQALEVPGGASRIAACWYSSTSFTVDVDVTNGQSYDLELYVLDYNGGNARSEQIQFTSAGTGAVLNTQTVSKFSSGAYLNYTIAGNVLITITKTGGVNAVLNGLFFDPATSGSSKLAIASAVPGDGQNTSLAVYGTSDMSNLNTAGTSGDFPGLGPPMSSQVGRKSKSRVAISSPGTAAIDLLLGALPALARVPSLSAAMPAHDLALEQVTEYAWGRRMIRQWGMDAQRSS